MTFEELQKQEFCRTYSFLPGRSGTLRPAGHRLCAVCLVEKEGERVCLKMAENALNHPTFSGLLLEIACAFTELISKQKPDPSELLRALQSEGSVSAGGETLAVHREDDGFLKLAVKKKKSRFWPFGR